MKKRRVVVAGVVATLLAAGGVAVEVAPAFAVKSDCPSGQACLWADANFYSPPGYLPLRTNAPSFIAQFNDEASSVYNHSSRTWAFYSDTNYGGQVLKVSAGGSYSNLQDVNRFGIASWNDSMSSAKPL